LGHLLQGRAVWLRLQAGLSAARADQWPGLQNMAHRFASKGGRGQRATAVPALAGLGAGMLALSSGPVLAVPGGQVIPGNVHPRVLWNKMSPAGVWAIDSAPGAAPGEGRRLQPRGALATAVVAAAAGAWALRSARRACCAGERGEALVTSAKSACVHPDREFPYLCGDCPRNPKMPANAPQQGEAVCAVAALVSSAKSACIHPDREFPYLCGDCPRNPNKSLSLQQKGDGVCAAAALVSSAKSACIHPDREFPNLCGDCPLNPKVTPRAPEQGQETYAAAAFISSAKSVCIHPDREFPYLCGDCPRN